MKVCKTHYANFKPQLNRTVVTEQRKNEIFIKAYRTEIDRCAALLTEFGVPEWVENSDSKGVPANAVHCRLKWLLCRRKHIKPSEVDGLLQREMDENLRSRSRMG